MARGIKPAGGGKNPLPASAVGFGKNPGQGIDNKEKGKNQKRCPKAA
jgi:hypothetical protein